MFTQPHIQVSGFDTKGFQALGALVELQKRILSSNSQRDYKPSQIEIAQLSSMVFRARVNNQPKFNQWFIDSVNEMMNQVGSELNKKNQVEDNQQSLLFDCLQSLNILIKYIYFSAVFIIDAKESNRLFSLGIQALKEKLIQPIIPKLISQIIKNTRSLLLDSSEEQIKSKLYEAKLVLETIYACGWQDVTIVKERDGKLILKQRGEQDQKNALFSEIFEKPYVDLIQTIINELPHKSPLTALENQIVHEHKILQTLAPYSENTIMNKIEATSILKVVQELEQSLGQMIDEGQDDEVKGVVELFKKVAKDKTVEKCVEFGIGNQFLRKQGDIQEFPVKPFEILSVTLKKYFTDHAPKIIDVESLILYVQKYRKYILKIFDDQDDIILVFKEATEVIANKNTDLCESLIIHLQEEQNDSKIKDLLGIIQYIHQPKLLSFYGEGLLRKLSQNVNPFRQNSFITKQLEVLKQLQVQMIEYSPEWFKVSELIVLCQQFKIGMDNSQTINIQIPIFCKNDFEIIRVSKLPESLRQRFSVDDTVILDYGYSIAEFNNYKLILSTSQLILLMILSSGQQSRNDLDTVFGENSKQLRVALSSLKAQSLIEEDEDFIQLNGKWKPVQEKSTTVFIEQ